MNRQAGSEECKKRDVTNVICYMLLFMVYEIRNKNDCLQALFVYLSHDTCELAVDYIVIDGPNEVRMRSA
ncbi:MAG: hypothetical protein K6B68_16790 [Eubacterium sp.]|nr:hypothetical protein [Eubacterium sp.]